MKTPHSCHFIRPLLLALIGITPPAFSKDFSVRNHGATGNSTTLDTAAIQKAIDAASAAGGGRVILPLGTYRSGSIRLKDKIELHLMEGAVLLGSDKLTDYQRGNWPALILADRVDKISITGKGTLNGNSPELVKEFDRIKASGNALDFTPHTKPGEELVFVGPTGSPAKFNPHQLHEQGKLMEHLYGPHPRPYEYVRPQIIEIQNCKGVILRDITIRNAACWVQTYRSCEDMLFERVTVRSTSYWNNDGIDIVDCRRVRILDCDIDSADDALCLKSDPPGPGCEDITVERCKLASRASAIKFGTGSHHDFKRIHISDIEVRDTYRSVVAIQTVDGAAIDDVRVERVKATNTGNAFAIRLGHRTQSKPPGSIANIILRDFDVKIPPLPANYHREVGKNHNLIPASIVGMPGHPVRGVHLSNIKIRYGGKADRNHAEVSLDQLDSIPENEREYPEFTMWGELPAWAFYIRHAEDVRIENSTFTLAADDFRPAIVADDAPRLVLDKLTIGSGGGEPVITVRKSPGHRISDLKAPDGTKEKVRDIQASSPNVGWDKRLRSDLTKMADDLTRTLKPWPVPQLSVDVDKYGAIPDGVTLNTSAIQKAINACAEKGGGIVCFPRGDYVTGTIVLKSGVMLEVAKEASLLGSTNLADYPDHVATRKTVMDTNMGMNQSLIFAEGVERIGLRGPGTIDFRGSQKNFPGKQTVTATPGRPFGIRILDSKHIVVENITLKDSACWLQNYLNCEDLIFDRMNVSNHANHNNDGLDIDGCRRVIVRNCTINSEDDAMCLKGASLKPSEDILIESSTFVSTCNALKIGTDTQGDFRRILARNLKLGGIPKDMHSSKGHQASTGITLATVDGGAVEDIVIHDVTITQSRCPIFLRIGERSRLLPGMPKAPAGPLRKVLIEDVTGTGNFRQGNFISGLAKSNAFIEDVTIRRLNLSMEGGGTAEMTTAAVSDDPFSYPDAHQFSPKGLPAHGFYIRSARRVTFEDITITPAAPDARPLFFLAEPVETIAADGKNLEPGG